MTAQAKRRRLGELLIAAGVLREGQLTQALAEQKKWGGKLGRTLVELGHVDEQSMVRALSYQLKLPVVDLDNQPLPASVTQVLTVDLCERYGIFPLGSDAKSKTMQIATSDPTNVEAVNDIIFKTGFKVQTAVATASSIDRAIRRMYYGESTRATATATPQALGVAEPSFDEHEISGAKRPKHPKPSTPTRIDPLAEIEAATHAGELGRMRDQLAAIEKNVAAQVRAVRALVELLTQSGLVSREEYLARVNRPD